MHLAMLALIQVCIEVCSEPFARRGMVPTTVPNHYCKLLSDAPRMRL